MEYMSHEGYDELVAELQHMVNVELPAVRDAIAEARDKGDLSKIKITNLANKCSMNYTIVNPHEADLSAWIAWSYNVFFKRKTPDNLKLIKLSGVSLFILIFLQNLIQ